MKTITRCPEWCAGGHHCTARLDGGTHASTPEVWDTSTGRVVATRHHRGRRGYLELRFSIRLPDEAVGPMVPLMRLLMVYATKEISTVMLAWLKQRVARRSSPFQEPTD